MQGAELVADEVPPWEKPMDLWRIVDCDGGHHTLRAHGANMDGEMLVLVRIIGPNMATIAGVFCQPTAATRHDPPVEAANDGDNVVQLGRK